jgi:hypothetical protein
MSRIDPPALSGRRYRAFGLCIDSDLALPELPVDTGSASADVWIRRGEVESVLGPGDPAAFRFEDDDALLSWREVGDFRVRNGRAIDYAPRDGVDEALTSLPLLGPVMGVLLQHRGLLTLHGSAIALDNGVAVFLGDKGAGKSTTAATLIQAGKTLLTDDIVAIEGGSPLRLHPAYPQVKLTREAESAIAVCGHTMARPHPAFEKTRLLVDAPFDPAPRAPAAAFVLERGGEFRLTPLTGADALVAMMRFSYATRFGRDLIHGRTAAAHLRQCADLARRIPVQRLTVPNGLERLRALPDWLEAELAALSIEPAP